MRYHCYVEASRWIFVTMQQTQQPGNHSLIGRVRAIAYDPNSELIDMLASGVVPDESGVIRHEIRSGTAILVPETRFPPYTHRLQLTVSSDAYPDWLVEFGPE